MLGSAWSFHHALDSINYDINFVGRKPVSELMAIAEKNPACVAFNTLGFLKYRLADKYSPSAYYKDSKSEGLYVHNERSGIIRKQKGTYSATNRDESTIHVLDEITSKRLAERYDEAYNQLKKLKVPDEPDLAFRYYDELTLLGYRVKDTSETLSAFKAIIALGPIKPIIEHKARLRANLQFYCSSAADLSLLGQFDSMVKTQIYGPESIKDPLVVSSVNNLIAHQKWYETKPKTSEITIVTGYWTIPSKRSDAEYQLRIRHFLQLPCAMIIYTDMANYANILQVRSGHNTRIIIREIENFVVAQYREYWTDCYRIDTETYHSPQLYMVWAEKTYMLADSVRANPFSSKYFFWTDIGSIISEQVYNEVKTYPAIERVLLMPQNKFIFSAIGPTPQREEKSLIHSRLQNKPDGKACDILAFIQGGFFGGVALQCLIWEKTYTEQLLHFIKTKTFGGKDQNIYINAYLSNPDNYYLLPPMERYNTPTTSSYIDIWTSYLYRLSDVLLSDI